MKFNRGDFRDLLRSILEKAKATNLADEYWTTENHHDAKWAVFDTAGDVIATAEQRTSVRENLNQTDRTANTDWIATACPKRISEIAETTKELLDRLEYLELVEKSRYVNVSWRYSHWQGDWSAYTGHLIHFDDTDYKNHVVIINGKANILEGVEFLLPSGTVIGKFIDE
ncbi:hypothetical protein PHYNN_172 [Pantoea phage Phynn]|nr:hypothetical protein PHYNN_172 [Pantoea phage Phynn]